MELLILAQTIFYLVISVVIVFAGVLLCVATYHLAAIAKHLHRLSANLDNASQEVRETIESIIKVLAHLPLMSLLFRKTHRALKNRNK